MNYIMLYRQSDSDTHVYVMSDTKGNPIYCEFIKIAYDAIVSYAKTNSVASFCIVNILTYWIQL